MHQNWLCARCHSYNDPKVRNCYKCRAPRDANEQAVHGQTAARPRRDPSVLTALLIGLAIASFAVAVWYWFDIAGGRKAFTFAQFVGFAIGSAVLIGGRGRSTVPIIVLSALLTAGALVVGEYMLISHYLAVADGVASDAIAMADPKQALDTLITLLPDAPLRPFMWILALIGAVAVPWRGLVG